MKPDRLVDIIEQKELKRGRDREKSAKKLNYKVREVDIEPGLIDRAEYIQKIESVINPDPEES